MKKISQKTYNKIASVLEQNGFKSPFKIKVAESYQLRYYPEDDSDYENAGTFSSKERAKERQREIETMEMVPGIRKGKFEIYKINFDKEQIYAKRTNKIKVASPEENILPVEEEEEFPLHTFDIDSNIDDLNETREIINEGDIFSPTKGRWYIRSSGENVFLMNGTVHELREYVKKEYYRPEVKMINKNKDYEIVKIS